MKKSMPPRLVMNFFKWFCNPDLHGYVEGDLLELYEERIQESGKWKADVRLLLDILLLFRPSMIKPIKGFNNGQRTIMVKSHVKVGFRNLKKHKIYSSINIFGLALGLTVAFISALFVLTETNYDTFHEDKDQIYRIYKSYDNGDKIVETVPFRSYLLDRLQDEIPAIESIVTIKPFNENQLVRFQDNTYSEDKLAFAASNFFDFFSFNLLEGSTQSALTAPYTVVISEEKAQEYFRNESPIGKEISIENGYDRIGFSATVTGVFEEMPENSHFKYDFLVSMATGEAENSKRGIYSFPLKYGYIKLLPLHTIDEVSTLIPGIEEKYAPSFYADYDMHLHPQPLLDIHLTSHKEREMGSNGDIMQVYIFSAIALFTLLIAIFNYVNLTTARATEKVKEVEVRKAIGASRSQLMNQFLTESIMVSVFAFGVAYVLCALALPYVNAFLGKSLVLDASQSYVIAAFVLITAAVAVFSGLYPAALLSGKKVAFSSITAGNNHSLRKALIIVQFSISSIMIVAALVVFEQWQLLSNQTYSFKSEEIVNIPVNSLKIRNSYPLIKEELLRNTDIKQVTGSDKNFISQIDAFNGLEVEGREGYIDMYYASIDADFFGMYGKNMMSGRNFIEYSGDSLGGIILNESAARLIGQDTQEIIGLDVDVYDGYSPRVIGVVEDFQFQSLHNNIVPMYFQLFYTKEVEDHLKMITIKVSTDDIPGTLASIKDTFKAFDEDALVNYSFLDTDIQLAYQSEERFSNIFSWVTMMAICIAFMGIFGITTAIVNQRKKEFGVRKVLGASVAQIVFLINNDFIRLVVIANVIAFPVSYLLVTNWLQNFAYHIEIGPIIFVITILASLAVALISSGYWSIKAGTSNPIDAIKTE